MFLIFTFRKILESQKKTVSVGKILVQSQYMRRTKKSHCRCFCVFIDAMTMCLTTGSLWFFLVAGLSLRDQCPYSEFFWSIFSRIQTSDWILNVFSLNVGKYSPEKLQIRTLFMHYLSGQCRLCKYISYSCLYCHF